MSIVLKYRVSLATPQGCGAVAMPEGSKIVHVDTQRGGVYVWAVVDVPPAQAIERRRLGFVGTGVAVPEGWEYVGTAATVDRSLIWHVYEEPAE